MPNAAQATRRQLVLAASGLAAAAAGPARAASGGERRPRADALLQALHAAHPTPALSAAVATPKGLAWAAALGKADLELDVAATPEHRFRLGSVSKVLTSTAAARLSSRGVLDLDAPISAMLPEAPAHHARTTLTQLLTHRGGVRHYLPRDADRQAPGGPIDFRVYPTRQAVLATFVDDPLVAPPGTRVAYSTFGYTLASLAMEAAAELPFPDLVQREIGALASVPSLEPDCPISLRPNRVSGYHPAREYQPTYPLAKDGWGNIRQTNPAYKWAGGGFLMTPSDLARFGAALIESPASRLTASERALLFTPITEASPQSPPLGLGWRVDRDAKGRRRLHHAGAQEGGRASLVVYPDLGLSIALASNVATLPGDVLGPSSDLADAFA